MISDSITNVSSIAAPTAKDLGKKRRTNKSAKIKQNKLGLRREQWLSQAAVNNKKLCKAEISKKPQEKENLDVIRRREEENESFMVSPCSNSSTSSSVAGGITDSSPNFSTSSSSCGFCSGNITEEEDVENDDGCVDDWEAIADALAAEEKITKENNKNLPESSSKENVKESESLSVKESNQAWRVDDELRPQGLPNLGKQLSFPAMEKRCFGGVMIPVSCPICYEDLDLTDSNFLPCSCGFRLCLFCHKTICDGDGRCPGCRKAYEHNVSKPEVVSVKLARSCSMFCRV